MSIRANISRRDFALVAGSTTLGLSAAGRLLPSVVWAKDADKRLLLSAPLTHIDWISKDSIPGAKPGETGFRKAWGPEGVRSMLDTCKATGWRRIHWRVFDGGRAAYHSKLMDPDGGKMEEDNYHADNPEAVRQFESYDYANFDTLAEAVRYGHEIGLEIYAWASINEDDHAWGTPSRFSKNHPECRWCKRDGTVYRSQTSFAFPEAMRYKLGLIEELLEGYEIDGLFLDWIRTGDIRDNPQNDATGVANFGYEKPLVDGFKARYGVDPLSLPNGDERWVRFRAGPQTEFMRGVRKLVKAKRPQGVPVSVMVGHPWHYRGDSKIDGNLRGLLLDLTTWAREGLIDEALSAGYYRDGGNAELAYQALKEETLDKIPIVLFAWVQSAEQFLNDVQIAQRVGAKQILFWEADYIDNQEPIAKEALQRVMCAHSAAPPSVSH